MVAGRVDLNHVAADDLEAGEALHELLRLAACEASDLRRSDDGGVRQAFRVRQTHEGAHAREARGLERVGGSSRSHSAC